MLEASRPDKSVRRRWKETRNRGGCRGNDKRVEEKNREKGGGEDGSEVKNEEENGCHL